MAEIQTSAGNQKNGTRNFRKNLSTRVDLTPMVDLGFLLITFFVFTTTLSEAKAMKLILPIDGPHTQTAESGSLTLIAGKEKVWYYYGMYKNNMPLKEAPYNGSNGIRQVIVQFRHQLMRKNGNDEKLMVLIKATPDSHFKNLVDLLDEMTINGVKRFALTDLSKDEQLQLKNK